MFLNEDRDREARRSVAKRFRFIFFNPDMEELDHRSADTLDELNRIIAEDTINGAIPDDLWTEYTESHYKLFEEWDGKIIERRVDVSMIPLLQLR